MTSSRITVFKKKNSGRCTKTYALISLLKLITRGINARKCTKCTNGQQKKYTPTNLQIENQHVCSSLCFQRKGAHAPTLCHPCSE